jgi:hypothetical protein
VEVASGDRGHMTFGVHHVLDVHVTPHSGLELLAIPRVNTSLIVAAAAQKHARVGVWREAERPDWVTVEWPELLVGSQPLVHRRHIPDFDSVVTAATRKHLRSRVPIQSHGRDSSPMGARLRKLNLMRQRQSLVILLSGCILKKVHTWPYFILGGLFSLISLTPGR